MFGRQTQYDKSAVLLPLFFNTKHAAMILRELVETRAKSQCKAGAFSHLFSFITIKIPDIHCSAFYSEHSVSETGLCLRLRVEPSQLGPIDRIICLRTPATPPLRFIVVGLCCGGFNKHYFCFYCWCANTETSSPAGNFFLTLLLAIRITQIL
jgi:hypothetical protein